MHRQYFEKKKHKLGLVSVGATPQAVYRQLGEARKRRRQPVAASVVEQPAPLPTATTLLYRCRKCDGRKCAYTQVQTRSADEAMTTFLRCTQCEYSWKE